MEATIEVDNTTIGYFVLLFGFRLLGKLAQCSRK